MVQHKKKSVVAEHLEREQWYLLRTKPNGEPRARENLTRQGFSTFLPVEERERKKGRRNVLVLRPIFPGYLFVAFDVGEPGWTAVNNTYGVSHLICGDGGRPQAVPPDVMDALFERTDPEGRLQPPETIEPGSEMRIVKGPFADWVAEVAAAQDGRRVELLLEIMGRAVRITTTRDNLARA